MPMKNHMIDFKHLSTCGMRDHGCDAYSRDADTAGTVTKSRYRDEPTSITGTSMQLLSGTGSVASGEVGEVWRHHPPEASNWSELFDQGPIQPRKRDAVIQTDLIGMEVGSLQSMQAAWEHNYRRACEAMAAVLKSHESMISMEEHERRMEEALMQSRQSNDAAIASCTSGIDREDHQSKGEDADAVEETGGETTTQENKGIPSELPAGEHVSPLECQRLRERVASLEEELHITEQSWSREVHSLQVALLHTVRTSQRTAKEASRHKVDPDKQKETPSLSRADALQKKNDLCSGGHL